MSDGERPLAPSQYYRAADAAADRGALRADRGGDRLSRSICGCGRPAGRARSPRTSRRSSTISSTRRGPGSTWRCRAAAPSPATRSSMARVVRRARRDRRASRATAEALAADVAAMRGADRARESGGQRVRREARAGRADRLRVRRAVSGACGARPGGGRDDAGDAGARGESRARFRRTTGERLVAVRCAAGRAAAGRSASRIPTGFSIRSRRRRR